MPSVVIIESGIASLAFGEQRSTLTAGANATTTFAAMAVSTAAANRYVVVAVDLNSDASLVVTVGGAACTRIVTINNGQFWSELWITNAPVTSGTTQDVVLTGNHETNIRVAVATYAIYGILSPTPVSTGSIIVSPYSIALSIPGGGITIGTCNVSGLTSWTWSSFTEDADAQQSSITYSMGSRASNLALSITETVTPASAGTAAFVAAVWAPA